MFATDQPKPIQSLAEIRDGLHISYSQINTYLLCPLKFELQYVRGLLPEFVGAALPFGSAIHEAIALLYKTIQVTCEAPAKKELLDSFGDHWDDQTKIGQGYVRLKSEETWPGLKDLGVRLLDVYYDWRSSGGMPRPEDVVAVEQPLSIPMNDIYFIGVIDLILRDAHDPNLFHLIDHKTAARRYDEAKIATDLQMTAYKYLLDSSTFLPMEAELSLNWDVLLKLKKPVIERYTTVRTDQDVSRLRKTLSAILKAIDAEVFYPNPGWLCGDCGYQAVCKSW